MSPTREPAQTPSPDTLARNWNELLQEIRVTQTGVQILTGFLLTVPFASRFEDLTHEQRVMYLAVLGGSLTFMLLVVVIPAKVSSLLTRDLTVGFERALSAV